MSNVWRLAFSSIALLGLAVANVIAQGTDTLRPGEVFEMRVQGVPPASASRFALTCTIGQQGTILLPELGELKAAGLTPAELERTIERKLVERKTFPHPTVVIDRAPAKRIVAVTGGVRYPQRLDWNADLTVSSVITQCGGLDDFSSGKGIQVVRAGKIYGLFNLKELQKKPARDMKLLPGDQVLVPE